MQKVAIIGAGISGLVAAKYLSEQEIQVEVFEKSRSLSGRCSTRRWRDHIVDHGAQYFTVSSVVFRDELATLPPELLQTISGDVLGEHGQVIPATGGKRYYYSPGNNRMGKVLSSGIQIHMEHHVEQINPKGTSWEIGDTCFDAVLVTTPWTQASKILQLSDSDPEFIPCLTAFFEFNGQWVGNSKERYALSLPQPEESLAWSACENYKEGRISGDKTVFVVQASEQFSRHWLEHEPAEYSPLLLERLKEHWEIKDSAEAVFNHRWRYARKATQVDLPKLPDGIFVAGDSRVKSKIESVWLDGKRAALEIGHYLGTS